MNTTHNRWIENARLILVIAFKDILEAVKNKNTISILFTSILMVVFYRYSPVLFYGDEPLKVRVYDPGNSSLVVSLENSGAVKVSTYPSEEKMKQYLAMSDVPELGLVIPEGFDQQLEAGETPVIHGWVLHWVNEEAAAELKGVVEGEIAQLVGRPVPIQMEGNVVYMHPDSEGLGVQVGFGMVFVVLMIGLSLVAHLFLEEKQNGTLSVLLVSPAGAGQIVLAKALAGLFYILVGASVGFIINAALVVHWELALLAVVCGALFSVSLGLWLGIRIENRGQLMLWSWILIIPLLFPMVLIILEDLISDLLPQVLIQALRLVPTVTLYDLVRISFANPISYGTALIQAAWITLCTAGVLAWVAWQVRQEDRGEEKRPSGIPGRLALAVQGGLNLVPPLVKALPRSGQAARDAAIPTVKGREAVRPRTYTPMEPVQRPTSFSGLRVVWTIAAKDIREATKNKMLMAIMLGVGLMVVTNAILPLLLVGKERPTIVVYDQGRSTLLRGLTARQDFILRLVDSQQDLEEIITESQGTRLGLVVPADFDQRAGDSQPIELQGYLVHWADQEKAARWKTFFEEQLGQASWGEVRIDLVGQPLYPAADATGQPVMISALLVIVIVTMGVTLVPLLLVDEKEGHTLEVLLASPASLAQVIAGKALAGSAYGLAAAVVIVLFNLPIFVHWVPALLAILLSIAFAVAVGLLVGMLSDNPTTTGMWGVAALLVLIIPSFLQFTIQASWPQWIRGLLTWMPGGIATNLIRATMAAQFPAAQWFAGATVLACQAGLIILLVGWLIHRWDR